MTKQHKNSSDGKSKTSKNVLNFEGIIDQYGKYMFPVMIIAVLYLFLNVCINNQFTNWDDNDYVTSNNLIKDMSFDGIKKLFDWNTTVQGNYHPLTMLTLAIDYNIGELNPKVYHLSSLIFHIIASILVYVFVNLLTGKRFAALIAALLFGIHPMHMESVAWVSGRKDVLYGTFYMIALIAYVKYVRVKEVKRYLWFALVVFAFFLSLLSKPSAVVLPLSLLLIDYYEKRKLGLAFILEKLPLFALSVVFGLKSMIEQNHYGAMHINEFKYTYFERIALGGYSLLTYLWKLILPKDLHCFYQYPDQIEWMSLIILIVLAALVFIYQKRNRLLVFGWLFFLVNIALLLQFIPVGTAIVAERYTYIPYIGLFIIVGIFFQDLIYQYKSAMIQVTLLFLCVLAIGLYGKQASNRCEVWHDNISLWNDQIEKEPRFFGAFHNLGYVYYQMFDTCNNASLKQVYFDSSMLLTTTAVRLNPEFPDPYTNLGELERYKGNFALAKAYYLKGLTTKNENKQYAQIKANIGLGIIYGINKQLDSTYYYLNISYKIDPKNVDVHNNLGNYFALKGETDSAISHYTIAIDLGKKAYSPYLNRAKVNFQIKQYEKALEDLNVAAKLRPDLGEIFYTRSTVQNAIGNRNLAIEDLDQSQKLGFKPLDMTFTKILKSQMN